MRKSDEPIIGAYIETRSVENNIEHETAKAIEKWTRALVIEIESNAVWLRRDDGCTEKRSMSLLTWRYPPS